MGLIKDALSGALGGNQVNNGFGGPSFKFGRNQGPSPNQQQQGYYGTSNQQRYSYDSRDQQRPSYYDSPNQYRRSEYDLPSRQRQNYYAGDNLRPYDSQQSCYGRDDWNQPARRTQDTWEVEDMYNDQRRYQWEQDDRMPQRQPSPWDDGQRMPGPPPSLPPRQPSPYGDRLAPPPAYENNAPPTNPYRARSQSPGTRPPPTGSFRPFILPQVNYGDGQPFWRAYSDDLQRYGISEKQFIDIVDALNVASTPNPENQIFQKAANIAGWFVPGAAGLGLMGGQIATGIAAGVGHASLLKKALSKANLEIFLPAGLEIGIAKTANIEQETGVPTSNDAGWMQASPGQKVDYYGSRVTQPDVSYPPLQGGGRQDPIAMLGRGLASKTTAKKTQDAQKDMNEGKMKKMGEVMQGWKWLIVRPATPDAIAHWKAKLAESDAEIQQAQSQAQAQQGPGGR